ncbi:MAG: hypothetical protein C0626_12730 [Arcobacter sp.]|uniref:hypothetical protein n=1 Tax=uncultured Arcobacter sp. TaxID=165434 RepID=UPI000CA69F00|nr:hypothetical protein [uncultured Arcobacter sp.]PLY08707.1 MAG: hypothetical protein C0626_12730 [Arcobacter sp.]
MKIDELFKNIKLKNQKDKKKVLFAHTFGIYEPCYIHDRLLAYSLYKKGFNIFGTFCDGLQTIECNIYGGIWGGKENFNNNCQNCQKKSFNLWNFLDENNILTYSKYISEKEVSDINETITNIKNEQEWTSYTFDNAPLGKWATDILKNMNMASDYTQIENYNKLGIIHLKNLLLSYKASSNIIHALKPDRIISNDSFYGMWAMWEHLAKKKKIPFYSSWTATTKGRWSYSYNQSCCSLDFSKPWKEYSKIPLSINETKRIHKWLEDRIKGGNLIIDTASLSSFKEKHFDLSKIDPKKPIALLCSNVSWDLAALNKEIFTNGMMDWVLKTIEWFKNNPQFQLIIKPHPGEVHPQIPRTEESVEYVIQKHYKDLPKNVFILPADVSLTVYDLFKTIKVGLIYTTSVGLEMAASNIPVITAAKSHYRGFGFTKDPSSINDYYLLLEKNLTNKNNYDERALDLAYKFIKFNFFHYYTNIEIFTFNYRQTPEIKINNLKELEKKFENFNYIVNCISNAKPILDETTWPKES